MHIADRVLREAHAARRGLHHGGRADLAHLHRERDGKGLERRARLEEVGDHAIADLRAGEARAVVRVVRRHVGEREHLAAAHVDRDQRAGPGVVALHRGLQRAVREALDLAVDRKGEVGAVLAGADRFDVLDDMAEAVADHAPAARLAAEGCLVRELDALLAGVVHAGKAD